MDRARVRGAAVVFGVAMLAYLADRASKVWAERTLLDDPLRVISGVLTLRYTTNSGGAFSLGQSAPWFFAAASIAVSAVIVVAAFRRPRPLVAAGLGLVLGGALGNLTDRAARGTAFDGSVIDFVDFHVWPVFNLADAAIVVGACLLVLSSWRADRASRADVGPTEASGAHGAESGTPDG